MSRSEELTVEQEQAACDHKFIDSTRCLKCGWIPPVPMRRVGPETDGRGAHTEKC